MQQNSQKPAFADPTSALSNYLDELLHVATTTDTVVDEAPAEAPAAEMTEPKVELQTAQKTDQKQAEREARRARVKAAAERTRTRRAEAEKEKQRVAEAAQAEALEAADEAQRVSAQAETIQPDVQPARTPEPEAAPQPQGRPEWAEHAFECLIFRVAGLQLAVPLVLLGAIHRMDTDLHQIPGRPRWFMGMLPSGDHNLRVVDTAEWVMAGRVPEGAREGYRFVIRLDQSEWGLACDEVAQSFTLNPDDVRWRSERSRRPWLAGTVVDHMCALLDVRAMTHLLSRAEKEHQLDLS